MIGQALRLIRSYHDLSQTEMSQSLNLSNSYLSEIESGKKQPSMEILRKYSDLFSLPLSSILFFSENLEGKPSSKMRVKIAQKAISIMEWNLNRNAEKEHYKKAHTKEF